MTEKTLTWVSGIGAEPDKYGNYYVNVSFSDDTAGFIGGKPEKVEEHFSALTALLNQPGEFILEEKGTTGKGKTKFKINGYPGWERQSGGGSDGGSGAARSSWYNSEEGVRFTQERTDRRTALMQAMVYPDDIQGARLWLADTLYEWLRKNLDVSAPSTRPLPRGGSPAADDGAGVGPSPAVGADTPLDGGGESSIGEAPPSPPITDGCHCGKEWGPNTTSTGKRVCVSGHVERFDE